MVSSGSDKQAPSVAHCTCTRVYDLESGPDGILQQHQNCLDAYSGVVDGRSGGGVGHVRAMGFTAVFAGQQPHLVLGNRPVGQTAIWMGR